MKPTLLVPCLVLAACGAATGADSTAATAAAAPTSAASTPLRATRAASAACASLSASTPRLGHAVTSKVRHIPDESAPCPDSTGVAPPLPR